YREGRRSQLRGFRRGAGSRGGFGAGEGWSFHARFLLRSRHVPKREGIRLVTRRGLASSFSPGCLTHLRFPTRCRTFRRLVIHFVVWSEPLRLVLPLAR